MKRVAVIGCSHSSYDQVFHGPSSDGKDWIHHMSSIAQDYEFHSFACEGHGPAYYDYALKEIAVKYEPKYFDTLIVQYTVGGRWIFPLNIGNMWSPIQNTHTDFNQISITENYHFYRLFPQRVLLTRNRATAWHVDRSEYFNKKKIKNIEQYLDEIYQPDGLVTTYESNFAHTMVPLYGQFFNHVYYFDFSNTMFNATTTDKDFQYRNNIGWDKPFKNYVTDKYGIEYVAEFLFDSSFHCSKLGNEVLVNEYLNDSLLGDHLGTRGKRV
jgi:hypothetical protein